MKIFLYYLKQHFGITLSFVLFSFIFSFVFFAFSVPVDTVFYAFMLSFFVLLLIGAVGFVRYFFKYKKLEDLKKQIQVNHVSVPEVHGAIEEILCEMIEILLKSRSEVISQRDKAISDMGDYYSIWAHQIKTPIAAIRLLLQTEETPYSSELSEQLFKVEEYVEMALNFIRSESSVNDLVIKKCNIDSIIKNAVKKYSKSFIRKKITLFYDDLNIIVTTDEKWLTFVFEQIISNALKYTSSGKISIYAENGNTVVIEDTGIGIDSSDLPRLFEKGFTGYNGREDRKSTGIGLYLCKKVITMLSHSIAIESKLNFGTKVKIKFEL